MATKQYSPLLIAKDSDEDFEVLQLEVLQLLMQQMGCKTRRC